MCHESWSPDQALDAGHESSLTAPDGTRIPAWRYGPEASEAKGACLLLPDIFGPSAFYHHVTALLGEQGYHAVMIDYFFRQGPIAEKTREAAFARRSNMDENSCLEDVSSVVTELARGQRGARVGIIGFCLSGTFAFDLTTMRNDLATVTFYGFPEGPGGPVVDRAPRPIDVAAQFEGPILSFWGDQDNIPMPLVERFRQEVEQHDVDYRQHIYPGVGHSFLQGLVEDGQETKSARDAWQRTLEFLDSNVAVKETV